MRNTWIYIIVTLLILAAYELAGGLHAMTLHPYAPPRVDVTQQGGM